MTAKPPSGLATSGSAQETLDALDAIDIADEADGESDATPAPTGKLDKTPAPLAKTPTPAPNRDPSSALPSIPAARREPSGAFPLPGMADPDAAPKSEDVTLIARLSVLDELVEESTKVEEVDSVLRAKSTKPETKPDPIALGEQASAERDKALGVLATERKSAAEFEDPGDGDDDLTVSATPGIISIQDEDEEDEDTTASQRPQGARGTPTPVTAGPLKTPAPIGGIGGKTPAPNPLAALSANPLAALSSPRLPTPAPLAGTNSGGPRLPAPTPTPGKALRLPTPSGGLSTSTGVPVPAPPQPSGRALTPVMPIPAPVGAMATAPMSSRSAIFNKVQLPMGGLVAFLVAAFGGGLVLGAFLWHGEAPPPPPPVAVEPPPAPAPQAAAPAPTP
ncbi:MAG TPA: hypothetical protein VHJ20_16905, partial [Polyangia bacterium]|nr:hypothetical protein [Polyangia bacterium]